MIQDKREQTTEQEQKIVKFESDNYISCHAVIQYRSVVNANNIGAYNLKILYYSFCEHSEMQKLEIPDMRQVFSTTIVNDVSELC